MYVFKCWSVWLNKLRLMDFCLLIIISFWSEGWRLWACGLVELGSCEDLQLTNPSKGFLGDLWAYGAVATDFASFNTHKVFFRLVKLMQSKIPFVRQDCWNRSLSMSLSTILIHPEVYAKVGWPLKPNMYYNKNCFIFFIVLHQQQQRHTAYISFARAKDRRRLHRFDKVIR